MDETESTNDKPLKEPEKGQGIRAGSGGNGQDNIPSHGEAGKGRGTELAGFRQISDANKESEEDFRNSMDACPLGIRVVTEEGELIYANQATLDIFGCKTTEN